MGWPTIDLDALIVSEGGESIAQIFEREGESAFRDREQSALQRALAQPTPTIIATGGGIVERTSNREAIQLAGATVVWLRARPDTIRKRLALQPGGVKSRPSLTGRPPLEEVEIVLRQRDPLYRALADLTLETDKQTPKELANLVFGLLPEFPGV